MTWHACVSKCTNVHQSKVGSIVMALVIVVVAAADGSDHSDAGVINDDWQ